MLVELRNTGEGLIYSVDQTLGMYGEKLEAAERDRGRRPPLAARPARRCGASDADELRDAVEDLQQLAYKMTEAMYERHGRRHGRREPRGPTTS